MKCDRFERTPSAVVNFLDSWFSGPSSSQTTCLQALAYVVVSIRDQFDLSWRYSWVRTSLMSSPRYRRWTRRSPSTSLHILLRISRGSRSSGEDIALSLILERHVSGLVAYSGLGYRYSALVAASLGAEKATRFLLVGFWGAHSSGLFRLIMMQTDGSSGLAWWYEADAWGNWCCRRLLMGSQSRRGRLQKSECQDHGLAAADQAKQKYGPNSIGKWHRGCGSFSEWAKKSASPCLSHSTLPTYYWKLIWVCLVWFQQDWLSFHSGAPARLYTTKYTTHLYATTSRRLLPSSQNRRLAWSCIRNYARAAILTKAFHAVSVKSRVGDIWHRVAAR